MGTTVNSNGTNIQMYEENLSNAQKFKFSKTRLENLVVDVSRYQGIIDWDTVKNEAGIYGTILRVSASAKTEDSMLARNSAEVKSKGIPYGIYIFSYAENEAEGKLYGEFVKKMISKYNLDSTLGIYLDLEWNNGYMNQSDYENVVRGFMSVLPNAKIYTNLSYARTYLNTPFIKPYITWIAQWNSVCTYDGYYKMWQFTNNGSLPGIDGRVDLNYYYLD